MAVTVARILQLPTDVFSGVLQYLPFADLKAVALTNRKFFAEANADLLWCLLCQRAGLVNVLPAGGCSWKSFYNRCGLCFGATATGQWMPLVGYPTGAAAAVTLHRGLETLPWHHASVRTTPERSRAGSVASIAIVELGTAGTQTSPSTFADEIVHTTGLMCTPSLRDSQASDSGRDAKSVTLEYFDVSPQLDDATRALYLRLDGGYLLELLSQPASSESVAELVSVSKRYARLLEVAWTSAATVVFVYQSEGELVRWMQAVSMWLPEVELPTVDFCTAFNTPDVYFAASTVADGLRAARPRSPSASQECLLLRLPEHMRRWLALRSDHAEVLPAEGILDRLCPLPKRYFPPGWISPLATPALWPCHVLAMAAAAAKESPSVGLWGSEQMRSVAAPITQQCVRFYVDAMKFEIGDRSQRGVVPLESIDFVACHRNFFFAALRKFSLQIVPLCGLNVSAGLTLLEGVKRDINTAFRELWRENQTVSRVCCGRIFDRIFQPVADEYLEGPGFDAKKSVQKWLACMNSKIAVYCRAAPGPRSREVLAERLEKSFLPRFTAFAAARPEHPFVIAFEMKSAVDELVATAVTLLKNFWSAQDQIMSQMQRETAVYTAATGNEWAANVYADGAQTMMQLRPPAEEWAEGMLVRCETLSVLPFPADPGTLPLSGLFSVVARHRLDQVQLALANEGEQRAANARTLEANTASVDFLQEVSVVQHRKSDRLDAILASLRRKLTSKTPLAL